MVRLKLTQSPEMPSDRQAALLLIVKKSRADG
jgi:hypothetical protein